MKLITTIDKWMRFLEKHGEEISVIVSKMQPLLQKRQRTDSANNVIANFDNPDENNIAETGCSSIGDERVPSELAAPYDDTFFENNLERLSSAVKNGVTSPEAAMEALNVLGAVASDTVKYVADQETRQEEIKAQKDIVIAKINATAALLKDYLDKTFDERRLIFAEQFKCVDSALNTGNNEMLAVTLQNINSLAASSPFKALSDLNEVQNALADEGAEWDI